MNFLNFAKPLAMSFALCAIAGTASANTSGDVPPWLENGAITTKQCTLDKGGAGFRILLEVKEVLLALDDKKGFEKKPSLSIRLDYYTQGSRVWVTHREIKADASIKTLKSSSAVRKNLIETTLEAYQIEDQDLKDLTKNCASTRGLPQNK